MLRLFTQDPAWFRSGGDLSTLVSYGNIGYAYAMVMLQAFNGAGDTVTPTIVNFFGLLVAGDSAGLLAGDSVAYALNGVSMRS